MNNIVSDLAVKNAQNAAAQENWHVRLIDEMSKWLKYDRHRYRFHRWSAIGAKNYLSSGFGVGLSRAGRGGRSQFMPRRLRYGQPSGAFRSL
jgi:hypothetical protein